MRTVGSHWKFASEEWPGVTFQKEALTSVRSAPHCVLSVTSQLSENTRLGHANLSWKLKMTSDTKVHSLAPFLWGELLHSLPWIFSHHTPTGLTPWLSSCLCWNITAERPSLAVKTSAPVTPSFLTLLYVSSWCLQTELCVGVCIFPLGCKLHESRSSRGFRSLLSVLCLPHAGWSIFVERMWSQLVPL